MSVYFACVNMISELATSVWIASCIGQPIKGFIPERD